MEMKLTYSLNEEDIDTFVENLYTSEYVAEIIDSDFLIEDSEQVSKHKDFYFDLPSHVESIENKIWQKRRGVGISALCYAVWSII